jgi:hypothetical protein
MIFTVSEAVTAVLIKLRAKCVKKSLTAKRSDLFVYP